MDLDPRGCVYEHLLPPSGRNYFNITKMRIPIIRRRLSNFFQCLQVSHYSYITFRVINNNTFFILQDSTPENIPTKLVNYNGTKIKEELNIAALFGHLCLMKNFCKSNFLPAFLYFFSPPFGRRSRIYASIVSFSVKKEREKSVLGLLLYYISNHTKCNNLVKRESPSLSAEMQDG